MKRCGKYQRRRIAEISSVPMLATLPPHLSADPLVCQLFVIISRLIRHSLRPASHWCLYRTVRC